MAIINILDKHTAELIAAGEVVERPASVVKELCENAIDAGATKVTVIIENGGIKKIEIQDNGCGIEPEYLKNAFIRHATSKIKTGQDLDNISTLGFRGEALASVAAVARVCLVSKTQENEFAYQYNIEGGQEISFSEAARPQGTTITVNDLFYNTPARMKFLKKDTSEATFIGDIVLKLALSHPEIAFKFIKDEKEQFFSCGDGQLLNTICNVLSRDFGKDLLFVDYKENDVKVTGYITPPRGARASRSMQYFFINGRYVKTRLAMAALENAYRGILMGGRFPGCVLYIDMPYDKVDVNVHPAKTEVRFAKESEIFDAVYRGCKSVLFKPQSAEKTFGFKETATIQEFETNITDVKQTTFTDKLSVDKSVSNICSQIVTDGIIPIKSTINNSNELLSEIIVVPSIQTKNVDELNSNPYAVYEKTDTTYINIPKSINNTDSKTKNDSGIIIQTTQTSNKQDMESPSELQYVGEVFKTYILAQRGDEFCFIDKHAAHERIIYEKLKSTYGNISSQILLEPISITLSADEKIAVLDNIDYLSNFGIDVSDFGANCVLVRSVPVDIAFYDASVLVGELAQKLVNNIKKPISNKTEWLLSSIACRSAIKAGQNSTPQELLYLAKQIIDGQVPAFCPHGRPVVLKLTKNELEKQFGRLG